MSTSTFQYFVIESYTAGDAQAQRAAADTNTDGQVSTAEAAAFAESARLARVGNESVYVKWDGRATLWTSLAVSLSGFEGPVAMGSGCALTLDGVLSLDSSPGENHSLTITQPPGFTSWRVTLNLPAGWSFGNFSGASSVNQTWNTLTATVDVGVAVFGLVSPPVLPPPPPATTVSRTESYTVNGPSTLHYFVTDTTSGAAARAERTLADADASGVVTPEEARTYVGLVAAAKLGAPVAHLRWDGATPVWSNVTCAAVGLEGDASSTANLTVSLDGSLNVTSTSGANHMLTVTRPAGFASWSATLALPADWALGNYSGVSSPNVTAGRLSAQVDEGVAVFALTAPPADGGQVIQPAPPPNSLLSLSIPLALVAVGLALTLGLLAGRSRARGREAALTAAPRRPFVLEGFLVLYKDGRLIFHQAGGAEGRLENPEVIGSMFTAVTDFIRDSFRQDAPLSRLTYGQNTILLDSTTHLFGAAIIYGEPNEALREELRSTLLRVESAYAGVVERWSGDLGEFAGLGDLVVPLFALSAGVTRAHVRESVAEKAVKVLSETEHFRGYVRLKLAVANDTDAPIRDAVLSVEFNDSVLRLARTDPASLPRQGKSVTVGEVKPGERMCVNYLFDPQVCNQTDIGGRVVYLDAGGVRRTASMKTRHAEIVCPIFFTPEHANVANLRRLAETSLAARDARQYRVAVLPPGVGYWELFAVLRDAVTRHDVRLVRNHTTPPPFEGRAWFFGQTKVGAKSVIIRVSAEEQKRSVEVFAATDSASGLTGLLAELHRSFAELLAKRLPGASVEPVFDEAELGATLAPFSELPDSSGAAPAAPAGGS